MPLINVLPPLCRPYGMRICRELASERKWMYTIALLAILFIVLLREIYRDLYKTLDPPYKDVRFDPPLASGPTLDSLPLPIHVVFTTFSKRPAKKVIEANTLYCWTSLHPRVHFLTLNEHQVDHNIFGTPVLSSLYLLAMKQFPSADTYTYINGDILGTQAFVETVDFVVNASRQGWVKSRFLIVGQRINVESNGMYIDDQSNLKDLLDSGVRDRTDAEDYFVVSREGFDWNTIPAFVVGRPGYDNWLVHAAFSDPEMDVIDATSTNPVIHQTDRGGKTEWGGKQLAMQDTFYNYKLGRKAWTYGTVKCSNWATYWKESTIAINRRIVDLSWSQRTQDPTEYLERQW